MRVIYTHSFCDFTLSLEGRRNLERSRLYKTKVKRRDGLCHPTPDKFAVARASTAQYLWAIATIHPSSSTDQARLDQGQQTPSSRIRAITPDAFARLPARIAARIRRKAAAQPRYTALVGESHCQTMHQLHFTPSHQNALRFHERHPRCAYWKSRQTVG
jgi:hypothetical protein